MKQIRQRIGFFRIYNLCDKTELLEQSQRKELCKND